MGDRTWVRLTVLTSQVEKVLEIADDPEEDFEEDFEDGTSTCQYNEVNYGNLAFLEELQKAGIPYDSNWGAGHEYTEGVEHCRYTPEGGIQTKDVYDNELNPDIHKLLEILDDHEKLKGYIVKHHEETTPLPWDNQEEYGKRYLAAKLIAPK